jgi:hypothetical protein
MPDIRISRVIGASGNSANATITIAVKLADGSDGQLIMDGPTAQAMVPTVHQAVAKLADLIRRGPIQSGQLQVQVLDVETAHSGYDPRTRSAVIVFDHGKPSQSAWRMSEKTLMELGQGVAKMIQDLSDQPRTDKPH